MIVVSDTSPITNLLKIGRLNLLQEVFQKVVVPKNVHEELLVWKALGADIAGYESAAWISIESPTNHQLIKELSLELDSGEAAAIALASELRADYLLIDERSGWKVARSMDIHAIGVVGVLLEAKKLKIVSHVMPIIDDLRNVAGFWLSDGFYEQVKSIVKE